jgi:GxxExxY protein
MIVDALSEGIIGACMEIHRQVGPGLLESLYEECLCYELTLRGIAFARQVVIPVSYKGMTLETNYRLDLVVENRILVELKAVDQLHPIHSSQLMTYLKLTGYPVGLLVNFNAALLRHGLRRIENKKLI